MGKRVAAVIGLGLERSVRCRGSHMKIDGNNFGLGCGVPEEPVAWWGGEVKGNRGVPVEGGGHGFVFPVSRGTCPGLNHNWI